MVVTLNLVASKSRAVNILGLKIRLLLEQWTIEIILIEDGDAQARDRYDLVSQKHGFVQICIFFLWAIHKPTFRTNYK